MLQRMFYRGYFLLKHPQASSVGRDKLLLLSWIGVSQKRGQILFLCGAINPVISSSRSKQITCCFRASAFYYSGWCTAGSLCSNSSCQTQGEGLGDECCLPSTSVLHLSWLWAPSRNHGILFEYQPRCIQSQTFYLVKATLQDWFGQGMGAVQRSAAAPRSGSLRHLLF